MPLYRPSELKAFLQSLGIGAKKSLSQNFLIDGNIIRKIVATAEITPGDVVLEIGPGPGALTEALLDAGARVIAVEKDALLAEQLRRLCADESQLIILSEDALHLELDSLLPQFLAKGQKVKLVANLPYQLTTPLITRYTQRFDFFSQLVVMVQLEVARRFVAEPATPDYGSISVFLRFYASPSFAFTVNRNCFYPAPKVDSAVVNLPLHPPPLTEDSESFFKMTRTAFGKRRKMLRGSLKELYGAEKVIEALQQLGLPDTTRPEELSLDQHLQLFKILAQ